MLSCLQTYSGPFREVRPYWRRADHDYFNVYTKRFPIDIRIPYFWKRDRSISSQSYVARRAKPAVLSKYF